MLPLLQAHGQSQCQACLGDKAGCYARMSASTDGGLTWPLDSGPGGLDCIPVKADLSAWIKTSMTLGLCGDCVSNPVASASPTMRPTQNPITEEEQGNGQAPTFPSGETEKVSAAHTAGPAATLASLPVPAAAAAVLLAAF